MKSEIKFQRHLDSVCRCGKRFLISKKTICTDLFGNQKTFQIAPLTLFCKSYFCPDCSKKIKAKYFKRVKQNLYEDQWRFLTLTTVNNFNNTQEQLLKINKDWNKLVTLLHKKFGKFDFIKSLEVGDGGMVHLHILINRFIPKLFILHYWTKYCGAFIIKISKVKTHDACIFYVMKYLNKTSDNFETNKKIFISGRRRISFSRNFKLKKNITETFKLITNKIFRENNMINFLIDFFVNEKINFNDFCFEHLAPPLKEYFTTDFKEIYFQLSN